MTMTRKKIVKYFPKMYSLPTHVINCATRNSAQIPDTDPSMTKYGSDVYEWLAAVERTEEN